MNDYRDPLVALRNEAKRLDSIVDRHERDILILKTRVEEVRNARDGLESLADRIERHMPVEEEAAPGYEDFVAGFIAGLYDPAITTEADLSDNRSSDLAVAWAARA